MEIKDMLGTVLFSAAVDTVKELLIAAVKSGANLYRANLSGANLYGANLYGANLYGANLSGANLSGANLYEANLSGANLYGANLSGANLYGANLYGADLSGANLYRANLYRADLYGANLSGADLYGANLSGANLYGANLSGANLYEANLSGANLSGANLSGANLSGANLYGADLYGAKNAELVIARLQFIPVEGEFFAWKKTKEGIVKLLVTADAKRSHGTERKCRCSKAIVLETPDGKPAHSLHDSKFIYTQGATVEPDGFDDNRWNTCGQGIHFYLTKEEAEAHN